MYNAQELALSIKHRAKATKTPIGQMLADCGLNVNAISELAKGKKFSYASLALIADRLDCSVDYLLGRTENPDVNR
mgnify:FL=1